MRRTDENTPLKYIDLFCGIGGFRVAATQVFGKYNIPAQCVFSSDIDIYAREAYYANFGEYPAGDITQIDEHDIPDHDILFAGFPCQPFSIIGQGKGFEDTRGTLFFDIARILEAKKPKAFVLENVKQLVGHDKGRTLKKIVSVLSELGYTVYHRVLNALDYGLPQKRERVFLVGFYKPMVYHWPLKTQKYKPLSEVLEKNVDEKHFASEMIRKKRKLSHTPTVTPSIWHENKAGHISSYPYSCALRAGASYNYLLVNGERRLTVREMLRLQGFPESFKISVSNSQTRKQAGNAVPVNLVYAVFESFLPIILHDLTNTTMLPQKTYQLGELKRSKPKTHIMQDQFV
ncbi:MAG: DNA (cytosine-5-)-methyltransferase [Anaerolineales bacterium]|jgi:DNA (cytosine-5)-methyltransferase 1|nr:DNA (cytosine-5-)-methyltransferase [Anaerolineales bacterium]